MQVLSEKEIEKLIDESKYEDARGVIAPDCEFRIERLSRVAQKAANQMIAMQQQLEQFQMQYNQLNSIIQYLEQKEANKDVVTEMPKKKEAK